MSVQVFYPFFNQVVCFFDTEFMNCSYILDINPLWVISFADIFSDSIGCVFFLSMVSFAVQKLLFIYLKEFYLFIYFWLR